MAIEVEVGGKSVTFDLPLIVDEEEDVVTVFSDATPFQNLHSHGSRDNITGGQILCSRCVPLHESLSFRVSQNATLTTTAFGHQGSRTGDARRKTTRRHARDLKDIYWVNPVR